MSLMSRPIALSWFAALLACALLAGAARAAAPWSEALATRALKEGPTSQLPPHLTAVLGLSADGQGLAVRQLVFRDGFTVHTFNVGARAPHRVVVLVADEAARSTVAYLLTPHGHLSRALEYHAGEAPQELSAEAAQRDFAAEVRFWSGVAAASAPSAAH
jgi:hypothetical protein